MAQYLSAASYRTMAGIASTEREYGDDELNSYLAAASRIVDEDVQRGTDAFVPAAAATDRSFFGDGTNTLRVNGFYGSFTVEGVTAELDALPLNAAQHIRIRRRSGYWRDGQVYTVNARWGIAETPDDVVVAVKQLADLARVSGPLAITRRTLEVGEDVSSQARGILNRLLYNWRATEW